MDGENVEAGNVELQDDRFRLGSHHQALSTFCPTFSRPPYNTAYTDPAESEPSNWGLAPARYIADNKLQ